MVFKKLSIPLYLQLEQKLLDDINEGVFLPGDMIPSENEIAKKYNVSRMTSKRAIDNLTIKNYVERIKGKGTFVINKDEKIELPLNRLYGFTQKIKGLGLKPVNIILKFEKIRATREIAAVLKSSIDSYVWHIERVRQIDNVPVVLEESYMNYELFDDLDSSDLLNSKFAYVKDKGYRITNSKREIYAQVPAEDVRIFLNLKRNEPVLVSKTVTFLSDGAILEFSTIYYNQKKYKFTISTEIY